MKQLLQSFINEFKELTMIGRISFIILALIVIIIFIIALSILTEAFLLWRIVLNNILSM